MSNYRQLLSTCVKILSTFNSGAAGVATHLEAFLQSPECNLTEDEDRTFVSEVFAGCVRYEELVKVVVHGFYATDGKACLRTDTHLYLVLSYLIMFRLEELGMRHFKRLVGSQHPSKMYRFLQFFFDDKNLKGWIKDEWFRHYDRSFVEASVLSPIMRLECDMKELVQHLSDKMANKTEPKRSSKPATEARPFNLTKPHPRSVPTPERIPTLKTYRPAPKSTYSRPADQEKLAVAFERNHKRAEDVLREASKMQPSCATTEKSEKTKAMMEQIVADREAELFYSPPKPVPIPPSMKEVRPVKLNAAAILREGARVQREEDEQEKRLASLEAGQRDASEFTRWQEDMKQKQAAEMLAEIERKHLEGQLSYEEAIIARQTCIRENKEKVARQKEASEEMMQKYFAQCEEEQMEMRKLVEATMANHQNTKEARNRLQLMKQKIVQQVAKESQELMARALEEAEVEMRHRAELIQQIRAMESVPIIRTKFVDLTETAGQGLLAEMSIVELRERLALMRTAEAEEEEVRRKEIASAKLAKEHLLQSTLESISRHRSEQNRQAVLKDEKQRETFSRQYEGIRERKLSDLQQRLEAKKKEREELKYRAPTVSPPTPTSASRCISESVAEQGKGIMGRGTVKSKSSGALKKSTSATQVQSQPPAITLLLRTTTTKGTRT